MHKPSHEAAFSNPEREALVNELVDLVPAMYNDYSDTIAALRQTNPDAKLLGVDLNETTGEISTLSDRVIGETVEESYSPSVPKFKVLRRYSHNPAIEIRPVLAEDKTVSYQVAITAENVTQEDLGESDKVLRKANIRGGHTYLTLLVNPDNRSVELDTRVPKYARDPQKALELTKELVMTGFPDTRPKQDSK